MAEPRKPSPRLAARQNLETHLVAILHEHRIEDHRAKASQLAASLMPLWATCSNLEGVFLRSTDPELSEFISAGLRFSKAWLELSAHQKEQLPRLSVIYYMFANPGTTGDGQSLELNHCVEEVTSHLKALDRWRSSNRKRGQPPLRDKALMLRVIADRLDDVGVRVTTTNTGVFSQVATILSDLICDERDRLEEKNPDTKLTKSQRNQYRLDDRRTRKARPSAIRVRDLMAVVKERKAAAIAERRAATV